MEWASWCGKFLDPWFKLDNFAEGDKGVKSCVMQEAKEMKVKKF